MLAWKWLPVGVALLLAGACGSPPPRPMAAAPAAAAMPAPPPDLPSYRMDARHCEVRVLVRRGGPMASLGHDHVLVDRAVDGWVAVADQPTRGSFYLRLAASGFGVDDAAARAAEGAEFAAEVPEEAKSGTRRNLLGAAVLDADEFPYIIVRSLAIERVVAEDAVGGGGAQALSVAASIEVAGHTATVAIPFTLERGPQQVAAHGSVVLRQTSLGLTPFSVAMGALQVQDELLVKFTLVAVASPAT
jgi:hypothetical protein